jgi:hypothetical protein
VLRLAKRQERFSRFCRGNLHRAFVAAFINYIAPIGQGEKKKKKQKRRRRARKETVIITPTTVTKPGITLPTPLSDVNASDFSASGIDRPCDQQIEAVFDAIASKFGGTFNNFSNSGQTAYDWQFHLKSISIGQMRQVMRDLGFREFRNWNPKDHKPTYFFGWGAYHWEGNVLGNWYHLVFYPTGWMSNEVDLKDDAHYEVGKPSKFGHGSARGVRPCP